MNFEQDSRFKKELKSLAKKYRNLTKDLGIFQQVHRSVHDIKVDEGFKRNFFANNKATFLHTNRDTQKSIVKARMDSSDLNNKRLRVIYYVDLQKKRIVLLEIYAKNKKDNEDASRWREYI